MFRTGLKLSYKLTLNISKTRYVLSSSLTSQPSNVNIFIDNILSHQVEEFKCLDFILDSKLKWKSQASVIDSRINKVIRPFSKLRNTITGQCFKQIYLSLVYLHFLDCISIWDETFDTLVDKLFIPQKGLFLYIWLVIIVIHKWLFWRI